MPRWIEPQLSQLVNEAPAGGDWSHEIMFDGYRMHARLDRGRVQLLTRKGLHWTQKYPGIADALKALHARKPISVGNCAASARTAPPPFDMIQNPGENAAALVFFLFDPLFLDGEDCRDRGVRRQPLRPARGDGLVRAQPHRLHLRPGRQFGATASGQPSRRGRRLGPHRGEAEKVRRYGDFRYAAKSWKVERRVIARVEAGTQGADSRFIVTNLPGLPKTLYDKVYCARGRPRT